MRKNPTIEELEDILNAGGEPSIEILSNGEVRVLSQVEIFERTIAALRCDIEEHGELTDHERDALLKRLP